MTYDDTKIIGKSVKDIYGSYMGKVVGTLTEIDGSIQTVGVDCGSNGLQMIPDEHLVIQEDVVIFIPKWRLESQRLIREMKLTLRRLRAMIEIMAESDEARQDAEIVQKKYSAKLDSFQDVAAGLRKNLDARLDELESQLRSAKMLFFDAKVQHKSGEIDEPTFETVKLSTSSLTEHISHEVSEISGIKERMDVLEMEVQEVDGLMNPAVADASAAAAGVVAEDALADTVADFADTVAADAAKAVAAADISAVAEIAADPSSVAAGQQQRQLEDLPLVSGTGQAVLSNEPAQAPPEPAGHIAAAAPSATTTTPSPEEHAPSAVAPSSPLPIADVAAYGNGSSTPESPVHAPGSVAKAAAVMAAKAETTAQPATAAATTVAAPPPPPPPYMGRPEPAVRSTPLADAAARNAAVPKPADTATAIPTVEDDLSMPMTSAGSGSVMGDASISGSAHEPAAAPSPQSVQPPTTLRESSLPPPPTYVHPIPPHGAEVAFPEPPRNQTAQNTPPKKDDDWLARMASQ